jgi:DNA-directed RNA polymerase subunit RPC12/RpoP
MIAFACPTCGCRLSHPRAGKKVTCPNCGQRILVPPPAKPAAGNPTVLGTLGTTAPPPAGNATTTAPKGAKPAAAKGPGEKYCHDCGAVIRAKAEICPKCGVRQPERHRRREPEPRFDGEPDRGTAILVIGVLSLFVMPLPLGLVAWCWANEDLRKMAYGKMNPEGRGSTQAGKVCGMISSLLSLSAFCCVGLYLLVPLVMMWGAFASEENINRANNPPPAEHRSAPKTK